MSAIGVDHQTCRSVAELDYFYQDKIWQHGITGCVKRIVIIRLQTAKEWHCDPIEERGKQSPKVSVIDGGTGMLSFPARRPSQQALLAIAMLSLRQRK